MHRRLFIKLTAISGGTAALASCGNPQHQLIRFIPDEDLVPGVAQWKPGICPACPAGCGLHVRVMEADVEVTRQGQIGVVRMNVAKKLEGNPAYPINRGGLCPRGQASIQITYHPDRIGGPWKRIGPRGSEQFEPVGWDAATDELVARLDALASARQQRALAFVTTRRPGVRHDVVTRFLRSFGAPPPVVFEVFPTMSCAWRTCAASAASNSRRSTSRNRGSSSASVPTSSARGTRPWPSRRRSARCVRASRRSWSVRSGRSADVTNRRQRRRLAPGQARHRRGPRVRAGSRRHRRAAPRPRVDAGSAGAQIAGWLDGLPQYAPAEVERITGVAAARVERLARDLAQSEAAVAIVGGAPLAHTNGLFHALAVNALNALVDVVEQPGGVAFTPGVEPLRAVRSGRCSTKSRRSSSST